MVWLPPRCESRAGAAHLRRGTPCQDASGLWCFSDAGGTPLQALVVSDGHGSARYDRSAVGSRLACTVALEAIGHGLAQAPGARATDLEPWRHWLAHDLPAAVLKEWRRAVLQHGQNHPRADGTPPSTLPYGATLGLLVLTPHWWGFTGLGDWDLVRTNGAGQGELLSEEPFSPGGGEATCSLCMEGAEHHWVSRSGLVPIAAGQEPFTLLLSTDGIRKSCGSDADFLTLARHLGALPDAEEQGEPSPLAEALDHISRQGSGDDVSVAIARWGQPIDEPQKQGGWPSGAPLIVQPSQEAAVPHEAMEAPAGDGALEASEALHSVLARPGEDIGERGRRGGLPWMALPLLALALLAGGAGAMAWLGWPTFTRREPVARGPSPELLAVLQTEARRLCTPVPMPKRATTAAGDGGGVREEGPEARSGALTPSLNAALLETINATLQQRHSTFRELLNGSTAPPSLRTPAQDPTGALIAWSRLHGQGQGPVELGWCPELREGLLQRWQRISLEKSPARLTNKP
jgi:Protein phosphatase 2C